MSISNIIKQESDKFNVVLQKRQSELEEEVQTLSHNIEETRLELNKVWGEGDLSENAGFDIEKEKLTYLEIQLRRVLHALDTIKNSNILTTKRGGKYISLGSTVILYHTSLDRRFIYMVVPAEISKVEAGLLSSQSPVGIELLKSKKAGEKVEIRTSYGIQEYIIEEVY